MIAQRIMMHHSFFLFIAIVANATGFNVGNRAVDNYNHQYCTKLYAGDENSRIYENDGVANNSNNNKNSRRQFLSSAATIGSVLCYSLASIPANAAAAKGGAADAAPTAASMIKDLEECAELLKPIPELLQAQKWDEVRNILKSPPVNYLWNMGEGRNTLGLLARATDEFGLIDLKDELSISLQMCDQEAYGNVFIYYQPGNGKIKIKEPVDLANKAMVQLNEAIIMAKDAAK